MDAREEERLIWLYQDGRLDEAKEKEVALLIRNDPSFAKRFADLSLLNAAMLRCLCARKEEPRPHRVGPEDEKDGRDRGVRYVGTKRLRAGARLMSRGAWAVVAACLAIVAGAHLYNLRQAGRFPEVIVAHVRETTPGVRIIRGERNIAVVVGMELLQGDRIRIGSDGRAKISCEDRRTTVSAGEITIGLAAARLYQDSDGFVWALQNDAGWNRIVVLRIARTM